MVKNNSNKSIPGGGWPWSNDEPVSEEQSEEQSEQDKNKETQFQFTRHLLSCNNLDEGKWYTTGKDNEPGGTIYGITETIKYAKVNEAYFKSEHVYVSNLYRTWITAVLLYGVNLSQGQTLNLYVSPHLKEYHGIIQRGNFPKEINHMARKFLKFLNALFNISPDDINNLPNTIILHLPPKPDDNEKPPKPQSITYEKENTQIYTMNKPCNIVDTSGPNSGIEFTDTGVLNDFMKWHNGETNYYNSPVLVPVYKNVHVVTHSHIMRTYLADFKIVIDKDELKLAQTEEQKIYDDTSYKKRFMNKFKSLHKLNKILETGEFSIDFDIDLLQYYGFKSDADPGSIYPIRNSNSWHFNTKINNPLPESTTIASAITHFDLKEGVPIKKDDAKKLEERGDSLCGTHGSVSVPTGKDCTDPVTPSALVIHSGGKTRKKRRHKTKKRMNKSRNGHKKKTRVNKSRKRSK